MHSIHFVVGLVGPVLQLVLLVILVRRGLRHRFRFFFAYTIYSILASVVGLAVIDRPVALFIVNSIAQVFYGVLALLAVREAFASVLEVYPSLWRPILWGPLVALAGITMGSLWRALLHRPVGPIFMAFLGTFSQWFILGVLVLEGCMFVACLRLAFRERNRFRWRRYDAGVLFGFGAVAIGSVPAYLARFNLGPAMDQAFLYFPAGAYTMAALTWLRAFYSDERPVYRPKRKRTDPKIYPQVLEVMQRWVKEAEKALGLHYSPF